MQGNLMKYLVVAFVIGGGALWVWKLTQPGGQAVIVDVQVPELSEAALKGKAAFDANCAQCHGKNASGTDQGPPLVHDIYNPGHHSNEAFFVAAKLGVRQHHWPYGNMPPQPQVSQDEVASIVRYVRRLQETNGITYRPHRM